MYSTPWPLITTRRKAVEREKKLKDILRRIQQILWECDDSIRNEIEEKLTPKIKEKIEKELIEKEVKRRIAELPKTVIEEKIRDFFDVFVPRKEKGVIQLFNLYREELGFGELKKPRFSGEKAKCDGVAKKNGKDIRIEFEKTSKDFLLHKHDPKDVDLVICWKKTSQIPVPVLELSKELPELISKRNLLLKN